MESIIAVTIGIILSFFTITESRWQGRLDLFAPPMLVLAMMWFQYYLPAFTLPYYNYWIYPHRWEESRVVLYPILISSVAWLAFLWGYRINLGKALSRSLPVPTPSHITIQTGWALTLVGFASLLAAIELSGGFLQVAQRGSVVAGTGVWVHLGFLILPGIALLVTHRNTRMIAIFVSIAYFVALTAAQARGAALQAFILLLIIAKYLWNLSNRILLLSGSFFVVFTILAVSVGRSLTGIESLSSLASLVAETATNLPYNAILTLNRDVSRLEQLSIVMELVPEQIGYFFGIPILLSFFGPFKKYLFPDIIDWRILLTSVSIYGSPKPLSWGSGQTGVGEWYANFGLVGVIIGFLLFGVAAKCMYQWFQQSRQMYPQTVLLPVYALLFLILSGSVGEGVEHFFSIWSLVPIMITSHWYRALRKRSFTQLKDLRELS